MHTRAKNYAKQNDSQSNETKIGLAIFDKSFTKDIQSKLIKTRKWRILENKFWKLEYKMFVRQKWPFLFQYMKSSDCLRLDLHDNQYSQIITSLQVPIFNQVVTLVLQKNNILSIEGLAFLRMDHLNFLDLDDNLITQTKALSKIKWPQFRKFQIRNNFIQDCQFSRMKTKHVLEKIYFDDRIDDNLMNQNINIFLKLEISDLRKLQIQGQSRIPQKKVTDQLCLKYKQLNKNLLLSQLFLL